MCIETWSSHGCAWRLGVVMDAWRLGVVMDVHGGLE